MDNEHEAEFEAGLSNLLNRVCAENDSDTPDFILAKYLLGCLKNFNETVKARENWYGRPVGNGQAILGAKEGVHVPCDDCSTFDFSCTGKCKEKKESDK